MGLANGATGGWGNLGGGFSQLAMPLLFAAVRDACGAREFTAWRVVFFGPALAHVAVGIAILVFGQDCPDGQYLAMVIWSALSNYRTWTLALLYGYNFGLELTSNNILAEYFFDKFSMGASEAGLIASAFGLMNVFTRPLGGFISDRVARRFGMRGRLWMYWLFQTLGGASCILFGSMNVLPAAAAAMLVFSFFVESSGAMTFGIVPFISRRAVGLVSGMVGAGGNFGSAVTQLAEQGRSRERAEVEQRRGVCRKKRHETR
eukprot:jgi/Mesen1/5283/ME000263S04387